MKKRKVFHVICSAALVASMLFASACTQEKKTGASEADTGKSQESAASTNESQEGGEVSTITVEVFDRGNPGGSDPTTNFYAQWIQEQCLKELNLEVKFVSVPRVEEQQQLNNMMGSGQAPDLCFTYDMGLISNYYQQGGLTDLTPYLADAPELTALLGEDVLERGLYDGKQMVIPARRVVTSRLGTFIRKDWLDALGLALPTTTEEYHNALKAFKENESTLPNKPEGAVVPLTLTEDVIWRAGPLLESFITPGLSDKELYAHHVVDSKLLMPGMKEGVKLLNEFYNEGLIDTEFPLYKDDTVGDDATSRGLVGSYMHNWDMVYRNAPGIESKLKENFPEAELVPIDPFANADGVHSKIQYDPSGIRILVPSFSKNPEGVVKYLNWLAKNDTRKFLQFGVEGETYDEVDGLPVLKEVEGEKIMNSANNIDYTVVINGVDLGDNEKSIEYLVNAYPDAKELAKEAYIMSMTDAILIPSITAVLEKEGPVSTTLKDKEKALLTQAISAKPEDFEAIWENGIQDWLAAGAQAAMEERTQMWEASN